MSTTIKFEHEAQIKEETYPIGSFFIIDGDLCELCRIGNGVAALISIAFGNRLNEGVTVPNMDSIKHSDVEKMTIHKISPRVSVEITTKPFQP